MIGQTFGQRYRAVRLLGAGGMGQVYEAEDLTGGPSVALKVISSAELAKNDALVKRFWREARASTRVDTEHIVRVHDMGTDPASGLPYMAMELLHGEDLHQLVRRLGPLGSRLALRIAAQVCEGLVQAHEAGIVHRDIKPANLFLHHERDRVVVKVLDFGIAKTLLDQAVSLDTQGLTRTGSLLGSPLYMSPEQARGVKTIDHRADIWSLGVVLYFALSGRTPHHHVDALGELILAICSGPPPLVQDVVPWAPPDVAAVVARCLRLSPDERYQSAREMLEAVVSLLPERSSAIDAQMLEGVSMDESSSIAPRLDIAAASFSPRSLGAPASGGAAGGATGAGQPSASFGSLGGAPMSGSAASPSGVTGSAANPPQGPAFDVLGPTHDTAGAATAKSYGGTNGGVTSSQRAADGRRAPWRAIGFAAVALLGGAAAFAVFGGGPRTTATAATAATASGAGGPAPAEQPSSTVATSDAPADSVAPAPTPATSASDGRPATNGPGESATARPEPRPVERPTTTARPAKTSEPTAKPAKGLDPNGFGDDRK